MGLAAPRKKTKISNDPNNTNWARSTSGFGHKILSSQGWTPGSFLGARDAAHADMFTAASASHIRVVLKDDTLGLGARPRHDPLNEPTGLDAFKGLLGRLNGKSDADLEADQRKREDVKLARYAATKWTTVRFISGGLLAQEKDDALATRELQAAQADITSESSDAVTRKTDHNCIADNNNRKTSKKGKTSDVPDPYGKYLKSEKSPEKKEKRDKKDKKEKKNKEEKKVKKDRKKRKRTEQGNDDDAECSLSESLDTESKVGSSEDAGVSLPIAKAIPSRERRPMGRHMFRGRHIEQKKKALMDDKSLNEIFMVKS